MRLHISDTLSLPIDAATQTFAFIGRKGSGKTYGSGKLAELLIGAGVQVAILDTVGNWFGLRLAADGKSPGIDIPILGGLRGDIPLAADKGSLIADVLADSGRSLVIDVSQFSKGDRQKFAAALGTQLWKRKKGESSPTPLHLILEESQLIVPENVRGETAVMVGIYEEIIRLGRNYGIGVTMITQRPQSVNKEVLNQTECLVVFQVNGAHERKALREWIVHQGMDVKLLDQLPSLKPGDCFVWSPQWLEILQRIHIAKKETFDSTATPRVGAGVVRAKEIRPINLDELKAKMADTIERAKADDPRELRKKIAELEKKLKTAPVATIETKTIDKPVITDAQIGRLEALAEKIEQQAWWIQERKDKVVLVSEGQVKLLKEVRALLDEARMVNAPRVSTPDQRAPITRPTAKSQAPVRQRVTATNNGSGDLSGPERKILTALAQHGPRAVKPLARLTRYAHNGGAFRNPLSALRSKGLIDGRETVAITDAGLGTLGPYDPLPAGAELLQHWLDWLPGPESKLLKAICNHGPISPEDLATATDYAPNGGAFRNPLSHLRSLGLIDGRGELKASKELLDTGGR